MRPVPLAALLVATLAPIPALAADDCATQIVDILQSSLSSPYRFESYVDAPDVDTNVVGEVIPGRGVHTTSTVDGTTTEMLAVDGRGFIKFDGVWSEMPAEMGANLLRLYDPSLVNERTLTAVTCLGTETIEGKPYLAFSYGFDPSTPGMEAANAVDATNKLFADPETMLAARVETITNPGGYEFHAVTTYEYDSSITIAPPQL